MRPVFDHWEIVSGSGLKGEAYMRRQKQHILASWEGDYKLAVWEKPFLEGQTSLHLEESHARAARVIHQDVNCGPGTDAWLGFRICTVKVLENYTQLGYMASLDYTKCCDLLRPVASA